MPNPTVPAAAPGLPSQSPRRRSRAAPPKRFAVIDPALLPEQYAMIVQGDCLEPEIAGNACLLFDKSAPFAPGDFVIFYKRPEIVLPGHHQALVKRLVMAPPPWLTFPWRDHPDSNCRALVVAEQLNPQGTFAIPCADLLAVHKCLGPVPADMKMTQVSVEEFEAVRIAVQRA